MACVSVFPEVCLVLIVQMIREERAYKIPVRICSFGCRFEHPKYAQGYL